MHCAATERETLGAADSTAACRSFWAAGKAQQSADPDLVAACRLCENRSNVQGLGAGRISSHSLTVLQLPLNSPRVQAGRRPLSVQEPLHSLQTLAEHSTQQGCHDTALLCRAREEHSCVQKPLRSVQLIMAGDERPQMPRATSCAHGICR